MHYRELIWITVYGISNGERQWRRQLENWGGGGRIFISSCPALLTSFEVDCFYGL